MTLFCLQIKLVENWLPCLHSDCIASVALFEYSRTLSLNFTDTRRNCNKENTAIYLGDKFIYQCFVCFIPKFFFSLKSTFSDAVMSKHSVSAGQIGTALNGKMAELRLAMSRKNVNYK